MTPRGTLYVCAVPIGNLEDASPRLRRVLGEVDAVACEDTRTTGRLLELLEVTPRPRLLAHHEHNERASAAGVVALLDRGSDVALVSDAGTPAVSDPGVELVTAAHAAGITVVAVPGPSAVASALSVAGLGGTGHRFVGFLPRGERDLAQLVVRHAEDVVVAFEAPSRLGRSLATIASVQPERELVVCRELSKLHEQVVRATAIELAERFADDVRGEVVLVMGAMPAPEQGADPRALELVQVLAGEGIRRKQAARIAAAFLGGSARELYDAANAARDEGA